MQFEFSTASRILFGQGAALEAAKALHTLGQRVLVVTGQDSQRHPEILRALEEGTEYISLFQVEGEPDVQILDDGLIQARESKVDLVLGLGGGSAMDTAKAIAALFGDEQWRDCLEIVGRGREPRGKALPCVTMPTTSGTGAEVTRNSVIKIDDAGIKVSLRHDSLLPKWAVVDPLLSKGMSPAVTAASGMDALTQLLEAYTSGFANPMTDALCEQGLKRVGECLRKAYSHPQDLEARENMAMAALFSGLALANAKLGAVHGIAGPLGGMIKIPHGAACAALIPSITRSNLKAMKERDSQNPALAKYDQASKFLMGEVGSADLLPSWLDSLKRDLRISSLAWFGFESARVLPLVQNAANSSSMKGNPIVLSLEELAAAVEASR